MKKYTKDSLQKTGFFLYNEIKGFEIGDVVARKYNSGDEIVVFHLDQELRGMILHNSGFGVSVKVLEILK